MNKRYTFERELAEMEEIRGIKIDRFTERDGTIDAAMTIVLIDKGYPLPKFPELTTEIPQWAWWLAVILMFELVIWMVR